MRQEIELKVMLRIVNYLVVLSFKSNIYLRTHHQTDIINNTR